MNTGEIPSSQWYTEQYIPCFSEETAGVHRRIDGLRRLTSATLLLHVLAVESWPWDTKTGQYSLWRTAVLRLSLAFIRFKSESLRNVQAPDVGRGVRVLRHWCGVVMKHHATRSQTACSMAVTSETLPSSSPHFSVNESSSLDRGIYGPKKYQLEETETKCTILKKWNGEIGSGSFGKRDKADNKFPFFKRHLNLQNGHKRLFSVDVPCSNNWAAEHKSGKTWDIDSRKTAHKLAKLLQWSPFRHTDSVQGRLLTRENDSVKENTMIKNAREPT